MSKNTALSFTESDSDALAAIKAGEVVVQVLDDEKNSLGYVIANAWLVDRPKVLIQKIIKDTGSGAAESFVNVGADHFKGVKVKTGRIEKTSTGKVEKEKTAKIRKHIDGHGKDEEGDLIAKYGKKIVPGTIRFETDGKYKGKRTVEIRCRELLVAGEDGHGYDWGDDFNEHTRRIATSDLFQVQGTEADHAELRKARRRVASKMRKINKK